MHKHYKNSYDFLIFTTASFKTFFFYYNIILIINKVKKNETNMDTICVSLPLSPISLSAAGASVLELGLGLLHTALVLFHLDPRASGGVKGAPNGDGHAGQHAPVAHDQTCASITHTHRISTRVTQQKQLTGGNHYLGRPLWKSRSGSRRSGTPAKPPPVIATPPPDPSALRTRDQIISLEPTPTKSPNSK